MPSFQEIELNCPGCGAQFYVYHNGIGWVAPSICANCDMVFGDDMDLDALHEADEPEHDDHTTMTRRTDREL